MYPRSARDDLDIISNLRDINAQDYVHLFAFTFLLYDHALTFSDEVEVIWKGPRIPGYYWFMFLRYFNTLGNIAEMTVSWAALTEKSCRLYNTSRQIFLIVIHLSIVVVLTLRIYAFYLRSKRILYGLVGLGAVLLGISIWCLTEQTLEVPSPDEGCHVGIAWETSPRLAVPWESILLYDTVIVTLTLSRSFRLRKRGDIVSTSAPIMDLFVRDGTFYFIAIALALLANVLTFYLTGPHFRGGLSVFASNLSVVLICRLILHFRTSFNEDAMTATVLTSIPGHRFTTIAMTSADDINIAPVAYTSHRQRTEDIELYPIRRNHDDG